MKAVMDQHPELAIVQDADRLDAIGAVGIGRTFTYNGAKQSDEGMQGVLKHFTDKLERLEQMMKVSHATERLEHTAAYPNSIVDYHR